jgi:hypothetical protein
LAHSFAEKKKRQEVWDTELALKLGKSEKFFLDTVILSKENLARR